MEQKLQSIREQTQEKYQKNVKQMQEEYQKKLEQEVQGYVSNNCQNQGMDSLPKAQETNDKITS